MLRRKRARAEKSRGTSYNAQLTPAQEVFWFGSPKTPIGLALVTPFALRPFRIIRKRRAFNEPSKLGLVLEEIASYQPSPFSWALICHDFCSVSYFVDSGN